MLDGELVALDAQGRSRFQLLQNAEREKVRLLYCVFDLLSLDGKDMRKLKLIERKAALKAIFTQEQAAALQRACGWVPRHQGIREGEARRRGGRDGEARLEPLSLRRAHARLAEGQGASRTRGGDRRLHGAAPLPQIFWRVAAGGAREWGLDLCRARRHRVRRGALARYPRADGAADHRQETCRGESAGRTRTTTSIKPKLVAEVKFTEWTTGGEMRHPVFIGLRTDKRATEVVRELPRT